MTHEQITKGLGDAWQSWPARYVATPVLWGIIAAGVSERIEDQAPDEV
jgi:hypothetical protein